ncbi:MAG: hypothetical protein H7Z74_15980 [Anaerolineae bacterium]|nr:hypothetical protein [Gemmatimonadaceae bacterium]
MPVAAQSQTLPPAQQIAAAVLPLPEAMREGATVLGYNAEGKLVTLRSAKGDMICLADDPAQERFHVACYHGSLEPFMARGRALRAKGTKRDQIDTLRFAEIRSGKLKMPRNPASLYSLTGAADSYDAATGVVSKASPLHVVYIPFATEKTTGLSAVPSDKMAWLMFPGTPKAHIMFVPSMQ